MAQLVSRHRGLTKKDRPTGWTTGQTGWRAMRHTPMHACGGCLACWPRRQAAWFYSARFVTWHNQSAPLHLLHQWTDAGTANGHSHTI